MKTRSAALARVRIAWPTLVLAAVAGSLHVGMCIAALGGHLPVAVALALNSWAAFAAFTVMHDASHRAVAEARWLNELVGRVAGLLLLAPFPALRYLHLEHHKHTNDPERDPDFWSASGPRWLLPLRWLSQDLHYYALYFRVLRKRRRHEAAEVVVTLVGLYATVAALVASGHGLEALLLWLLPARLAVGMLAFAFDYLPHRPHQVRSRDDRFAATSILVDGWLTPLFLCQNYHLVHHLYPAVPFYRYTAVWREQRHELLAQGARVERIASRLRAPWQGAVDTPPHEAPAEA
jgi:fatty acid desaturase